MNDICTYSGLHCALLCHEIILQSQLHLAAALGGVCYVHCRSLCRRSAAGISRAKALLSIWGQSTRLHRQPVLQASSPTAKAPALQLLPRDYRPADCCLACRRTEHLPGRVHDTAQPQNMCIETDSGLARTFGQRPHAATRSRGSVSTQALLWPSRGHPPHTMLLQRLHSQW